MTAAPSRSLADLLSPVLTAAIVFHRGDWREYGFEEPDGWVIRSAAMTLGRFMFYVARRFKSSDAELSALAGKLAKTSMDLVTALDVRLEGGW